MLENVKNVSISDINITWPENMVPKEWRINNKIENGSLTIRRINYFNPRQAEFTVIWGREFEIAVIHIPQAKSFVSSLPKADIKKNKKAEKHIDNKISAKVEYRYNL